MARRAPTLKEIAHEAGVHVSTASRVLRQPEPVDGWSESALKIREVAAKLGYQRNLWAASLRTRRTTTIGAVMPRLTDGVVATVYEGVEEVATARGYSVLLCSPPDSIDAQRHAVDSLVARQVDGLLLSSIHLSGGDFIDELGAGTVPVLLLNRHAGTSLPYVSGDDHRGGYLVGRHLLDRGHTKVAIVAGPDHASTAQDRLAGFVYAMRESGIELTPRQIRRSGFDVSSGRQAGTELLCRPDRPEAIFAVSDVIAIGVLGAARDLGLRIPEDLRLIGYNDIPIAKELPVPLTTVHSPARQIGATGVGCLIDLIDGQPVESVKLAVELIVRGT
ncbi:MULTISPECIES: LacI family DNA-binding transcriptional regulator [unclassified Mycolicibacterium]|uniref:LacI family DNA-binding transcriptional regulator n=1 Tax=unclassified Mycolicibacterium TaxID=2636767 RepID=UPI00281529CC|nr:MULTISPECIES: LacI family DNA-binding transcriptional regulator [unclassified Mycolicibacterium]